MITTNFFRSTKRIAHSSCITYREILFWEDKPPGEKPIQSDIMKFTIGDCLAIRTQNDKYLAAIITSFMHSDYLLTLADYSGPTPPPTGFFQDCHVYIRTYNTGEVPILALELILIEVEGIDQCDDVILLDRLDFPTQVNSAGFTHIEQITQLPEIYSAWVRDANHQIEEASPAFESKSVIGLNEFLKSVPEPNEFPTVKLYKEIDGITHYWQIYGSSIKKKFLVIGHGKLGESGEYVEISDRDLSELRQTYRIEIARKKKEGYKELDELHPMILQFQTNDSWGNTDDLDFRNEVWDYLDGFLFWTGNGKISGGDIGSGTINLFFEAVEPSLAVNTIVQALEEKEIRQPYVIAQENIQEQLSNAFQVKVLHPKDFNGEFSY